MQSFEQKLKESILIYLILGYTDAFADNVRQELDFIDWVDATFPELLGQTKQALEAYYG